MPPPGGDFIAAAASTPTSTPSRTRARVDGEREIEIHAPNGGLKPCAIFMDEPSVMGTENALMAAALTPGPTTIANAACEPSCRTWSPAGEDGGADRWDEPNVMTVHGRDKLGGAEHRICADHIEVASFGAKPVAAATGGELRIRDAEPQDRDHDQAPLPPAWGSSRWSRAPTCSSPRPEAREVRDFGDAIPKIDDGRGRRSPLTSPSIALARPPRRGVRS